MNGIAGEVNYGMPCFWVDKQPTVMVYERNEFSIALNGEIYNADEIRKDLTGKGHSFMSDSDDEVVLRSYIEWGSRCLDRFNGAFAFGVWDHSERTLFIARDRLGIKSLFYSFDGDSFFFGSEIKSLLNNFTRIKPKIDSTSIAEIMLIGPGRTPGYGVFKGIDELKPGHCALVYPGGFRVWEYWRLEDREHTDTFEQTVEKVRYLLSDSVKRQLESEAPICTFLSGGLDSSLITVLAKKYLADRGKSLETFSVRYIDNEKYFKPSKFQPNSDESFVEIMNDYLGLKHHDVIIGTSDLVDALYDAVEARDLPGMADVDSSLLLFCKQVARHAKVALSGECADEIFGGYPWFRDESVRSIDGFPWAQTTKYRSTFLKDEFLEGIDPQKYVYDKYTATVACTSKLQGISPLESRIKEISKLNIDWFMQTLLERSERMGSHGGINIRVPFCDHRIAEYLYSVPWEMKDYKNREKGLLREAMTGLLPDEILWRKKSPYPKTHNPAYLKELSRILEYIIHDSSAPIHQIVKKSELINLLNTSSEIPWYGQLMTTPQTIAYMIQVNYWLQKYKISLI